MQDVTKKRIDRYNKQYENFEKQMRQETGEGIKETIKAIDTYNQQRLEEAKEQVEKSPTSLNYFRLGHEYRNIEEYEKAVFSYTKAIALDEKDAKAYNNRGETYYVLEKYEEALKNMEALEKVYRRFPKDPIIKGLYQANHSKFI